MILLSELEEAYRLQQERINKNIPIIERDKEQFIQIQNDHVQVISGIRRSGKSTLLRQIMKQYKKVAHFNFEDPRLANFTVEDFAKLDKIIPKDVDAYFFDEIQNVVGWEIYVRQLHDYGKKVFVTGSNASLLGKELGTKLTGRYLSLELFPFSLREYLKFKKMTASPENAVKYLSEGGFPEYLKSENVESLQNLFKDIVLRDVAIRYGVRNTKTLVDIALFLLSNIGKETTYNRIKNIFQVGSSNSVMDYLSWLEDAYLLFFLNRFSYSAKSMAVNPRKVYAIDNGLVLANTLSLLKDQGRLLENAVYIHLRNQDNKMFYFKEKHECDFVLFNREKPECVIQVCYEINSDNQLREFSGLLEAMEYFGLEEGQIITLNQNDTMEVAGKKITLLSFNRFVEE
jgi:predicted AAA+ superfamily ATPase